MQSGRSVPWREENLRRHDASRHLNQNPPPLWGRRVSQWPYRPRPPISSLRLSSAVHAIQETSACSLHTGEVQGSIPCASTIRSLLWGLFSFLKGRAVRQNQELVLSRWANKKTAFGRSSCWRLVWRPSWVPAGGARPLDRAQGRPARDRRQASRARKS
jgi:hypothetical protein